MKSLYAVNWINAHGVSHLINAVGVDAEEAIVKSRLVLPKTSLSYGPYRLYEVHHLGVLECE